LSNVAAQERPRMNPPSRCDGETGPEAWPDSPEDLGKLVDRYSDRLLTYACRRLGDLLEAEDVVQEVFLRVLAGRGRHAAVANVAAYLFRMVTNACIDHQRVLRRRPPHVPDEVAEATPHPSADPTRLVALQEEAGRIERLFRCLPARQAETARLRVFGELSLAEIAEIEGCSVSTVNSRLRYAFAKLRQMVAEGRS
jgi:RNA polymerase sigma-70 factor (ECF subfamily)